MPGSLVTLMDCLWSVAIDTMASRRGLEGRDRCVFLSRNNKYPAAGKRDNN